MQNFEFNNPTHIIFGKDTIGRIGESVAAQGVKKLLFIAGGGSIKTNGVYEQASKSLEKEGIEVLEAWGIQPNPILSKVRELVKIAKAQKVDGVLAVGGGSVIDTAVAAAIYVDDAWELFEQRFTNTPALPVFTILTLSAAGSEFDAGAVITNEEEKKKWFFMNPNVAPKVSIIDPSVQAKLPWYQTVNGAVDAMSHIMETYFTAGDNEVTLALCESLLRTLISSTDRLQKNEDDYAARGSLAWAAALALSGVCHVGQTGADSTPHALEHGISAFYPEVSHGAGLAVVNPGWIEYCAHANPDHFARWAANVWECDSVENAVAVFRSRLKQWGHPVTLKELGVEKERLGAISENALAFKLPALVKEMKVEDMELILKAAYQ